MSHKAVEFFFDVGSPTAYLACTQLPAIAKEAGANIVWRPMLLGGVFKATGNQSPVTVPAKGQWMGGDLPRWAQRYLVPFQPNPFFPINTLTLMRGATGIQMRQPERLNDYLRAVFKAMWAKPVNMGDPEVMATTLAAAGFDPTELMALVKRPRSESPTGGHHRRSGAPWRLWRTQLLRRRRAVLRSGPARFRAGSPGVKRGRDLP